VLDGQSRVVEDMHGMYQYYLKLVPTTYRPSLLKKTVTHQYSVTEHMRHVSAGSGRGLPGVYFFYETSPIHAEFVEVKPGFWRFLTTLCGLVGGVFTLFGAIEKIVVYLFDMRKKGKSVI